MKTKQKSVRIFEIVTDDYNKLVEFIEKKGILLKRFLLVVKTNNDEIKNYFENKPFEVRFVEQSFEPSNDKINVSEEIKDKPKVQIIEKIVEKVVEKEINSTNTKIFGKIVRGGSDIKEKDKLVFLEKINAGTKVYSNKEIEIFGEVFGRVMCDGDYMIVKKAQKGTIVFHNEELDEIKKLSFISKDGIKEL